MLAIETLATEKDVRIVTWLQKKMYVPAFI